MSKDRDIVLTPDSARRIADAVRYVENLARGTHPGRTAPRIIPYTKLGITSGPITARTGKTPGTGTVQLYTYDGPTDLLVLNGSPVTVKNWTGSVIAATSDVWVEINVIDGFFWYNGDDCSGVTP